MTEDVLRTSPECWLEFWSPHPLPHRGHASIPTHHRLWHLCWGYISDSRCQRLRNCWHLLKHVAAQNETVRPPTGQWEAGRSRGQHCFRVWRGEVLSYKDNKEQCAESGAEHRREGRAWGHVKTTRSYRSDLWQPHPSSSQKHHSTPASHIKRTSVPGKVCYI